MNREGTQVADCATLEQVDALYASSAPAYRRQIWEYLFDQYSRNFAALLGADIDAGNSVELTALLEESDPSRIPAHYRVCLPGRLSRLVASINQRAFSQEDLSDSLFREPEDFTAFQPAARRTLEEGQALALPLLMLAVGAQNEGHVFYLNLRWVARAGPALLPAAEMLTVTLDGQFSDVVHEAGQRLAQSQAQVAVYWSVTRDGARRRDLTRLEGRSACAALFTGIDVIVNSL